MSRPRSAPACSTAIRMSFSISLRRTISLESACEALTTVSTSNCLTGVPIVEVVEAGSSFLVQARVAFVELLHLAERAPAVVAVPRVAEIRVGNRLEAARQVEPRGHLMGQRFVLDEAVLASRLNGLLVQTHRVDVAAFDAGDLSQHQHVLVGERRRIVFGPLAQLFPVRRQEVAPPGLLVGRRVLIECRHSQRRIVEVVEQLDLGGYGPKQRLRLARLPRAPRRSPPTGTAPSV